MTYWILRHCYNNFWHALPFFATFVGISFRLYREMQYAAFFTLSVNFTLLFFVSRWTMMSTTIRKLWWLHSIEGVRSPFCNHPTILQNEERWWGRRWERVCKLAVSKNQWGDDVYIVQKCKVLIMDHRYSLPIHKQRQSHFLWVWYWISKSELPWQYNIEGELWGVSELYFFHFLMDVCQEGLWWQM